MEIKHKTEGTKQMFYMEADGAAIALIQYIFAGDTKIIIEHTEVSGAYEGKGLGKQLVMAVVKFAREKNIKIMPLCPYAKRILTKSDEFADVLF